MGIKNISTRRTRRRKEETGRGENNPLEVRRGRREDSICRRGSRKEEKRGE